MIVERTLASYASQVFAKYPVVTITGPRQSGKTTMVRSAFATKPYANLERPDVRAFAMGDPLGFLRQFPEGAILDEIQRAPDLISYIQAAVDEAGANGLFVLTGSHQFDLMQNVSQSLAGRTALLRLLPFSIEEMKGAFPVASTDALMFRGFYPRIHAEGIPAHQALSDYYGTYIERDLRQLVQIRDLSTFETFVKLCAGRVGQLLNMNGLANDAGVSHTTATNWLNILEASYIVFRLPPYHTSTTKRLVKSAKLYFYDVGLAVHLCSIEHERQLHNYPLRGSFFENMVIVEALKNRVNRGRQPNLSFYRDSTGNEVDLLYPLGPNVLPVEIKSGQTVTADYFKGLQAFERFAGRPDSGAIVVYGGQETQRRTDVTVSTLQDFSSILREVEAL